ncbi:MAG: hypothetical protein IKQ45_06800 [Clostridia bacterium]|nr:hypothetical protein [Clostridia bacterium]
MNQDTNEAQVSSWEKEHPWLGQGLSPEDEDSVDEVIRYTLDELRFA